ncbi:MAG: PTS sugar transporter subunit IIC [Elusimicrobia bacterium]|nr:PTS sugar transporter subunit IIC [Elusimicrobiota bacterium]
MTAAAACALLAVLELDAVLVAQTLASRPLVVGALLGALTGRPQAGMLFGAVFELLSLCDLPVGGCLTWSAPVAAGTAAVIAGGGASIPLAFAGGVLAGILHSKAEAFERARRASTGDALVRRAESGGSALGRALAYSIALHALMTFVVAGAVTAAAVAVDRRWWASAPEFLRAAAALMAASAPWLGLSGVTAWGLRRS